MQHASDDHPVAAVIERPAKVIENMRCGASTARGQFDMEGSQARGQVVPAARARAIRILGDHLGRSSDKLGVPLALQSSKLSSGLAQDVDEILICRLGELMVQVWSARRLVIRLQLGSDFGNRSF
jgi:hypothetical protein